MTSDARGTAAGDAADGIVSGASAFHDAAGALRDLSSLDSAHLSRLLRTVRQVQADAATLVARIGHAADVLAAAGRAAPAAELLLGEGQVRADTARAEAKRAAVLGWAPTISAAMADGEVSNDHLDSLARHTNRLSPDDRARLPIESLATDAARLPADTFDAAVRRAVASIEKRQAQGSADQKRAASVFRHWRDERAGMGRFVGSLDLERYELLTSAVDQRTRSLASEGEGGLEKNANLAAAALVDLVAAGHAGGSGRRVTSMSVVVDLDTLAAVRAGLDLAHDNVSQERSGRRTVARTGNGHDLTAATISRLSCDAELRRVVMDARRVPVDVGRSQRTATDAQWAALRSRYSTCGWPSCGRPISHCQIHHVRPWRDGGPTDLANLVPLCSHHHHRVHEGGWTLRLMPDRRVRIWRPDGHAHRPPAVIDDDEPP
ncbi:MAG: HNH endonuclease [Actinomycetota bacterium]